MPTDATETAQEMIGAEAGAFLARSAEAELFLGGELRCARTALATRRSSASVSAFGLGSPASVAAAPPSEGERNLLEFGHISAVARGFRAGDQRCEPQ